MAYSIHFLPARYGDCIWIQYGSDEKKHNILIDGGTGGTREHIREIMAQLPEEDRHIELLIITHVDRDHIEGVLRLLEEGDTGFTIRDCWFNGWDHLQEHADIDTFGPEQGEDLSAAILKNNLPWNNAFGGKSVVVTDELPVLMVKGMKLTLLSPYPHQLKNLIPVWKKAVEDAGLVPGYGTEPESLEDEDIEAFGNGEPNIEQLNKYIFKEDKAAANGSSIAILAEFDGKSALLTGDAHPSIVLGSLQQIFGENDIPIDLLKLSHHGSKGNTSPNLIETLRCKKYVISTNGSNYYHPDPELVSWVIKRSKLKPTLIFNYKTKHNDMWDNASLQDEFKYKTIYPQDGSEGITVHL